MYLRLVPGCSPAFLGPKFPRPPVPFTHLRWMSAVVNCFTSLLLDYLITLSLLVHCWMSVPEKCWNPNETFCHLCGPPSLSPARERWIMILWFDVTSKNVTLQKVSFSGKYDSLGNVTSLGKAKSIFLIHICLQLSLRSIRRLPSCDLFRVRFQFSQISVPLNVALRCETWLHLESRQANSSFIIDPKITQCKEICGL